MIINKNSKLNRSDAFYVRPSACDISCTEIVASGEMLAGVVVPQYGVGGYLFVTLEKFQY
jgi:hypothetical protein